MRSGRKVYRRCAMNLNEVVQKRGRLALEHYLQGFGEGAAGLPLAKHHSDYARGHLAGCRARTTAIAKEKERLKL